MVAGRRSLGVLVLCTPHLCQGRRRADRTDLRRRCPLDRRSSWSSCRRRVVVVSSWDDVGCARHVNVGYPPATKATAMNWTYWSRRWESNPRPDDYKRTLPFRLPSFCVPGRLISAARRGSCPRGLKTGGPPCDTLRGSCWAEVGLKLIFQPI